MTLQGDASIDARLRVDPKTWLVTGVAGFIGSNILERLLALDQKVVGLDNFETGFEHNLSSVRNSVGEPAWSRFRFIEGDIRSMEDCRRACDNVDFVLHQAALGSVPRSVKDPVSSNAANITGFRIAEPGHHVQRPACSENP